MVTLQLLQSLCPRTKTAILEQYVGPLNDVITYYDLSTSVEREAAFLAQIIHESGAFNFVKEGLNYSAEGLRKTFGKYFTSDQMAQKYARRPEMIANKVYANRMGNGDEESGDGYRFCGRGLIQLTGRNNYTKFADALEINIEDCVAYMETPAGAVASAGWFWDINGLNSYCDSGDFIGLTKRINGGTNGLADRQYYYQQALKLLRE